MDSIMLALFSTINLALDIYLYFVIASAIYSWVYSFNIINTRNPFVAQIGTFLYQVTEPALRPIRRFMPNLGGVDVSPIVLYLIIFFIKNLIIHSLEPMFL
jgi:YggT family protein